MKWFLILLNLCLMFLVTGKNEAKTLSKKALSFDIEGHRGCRGLMPENTIPAMLKAMEIGVNTLEMDVCFSKDKKIFLSHEPFFNHEITTQPNGNFISEEEERSYNTYQMNYDSIIRYDVGLKPHPRFPQQGKTKAVKPLLSDVFIAVKEYMSTAKRAYPFFNIETKCLPETDNTYHPEPKEFIELLMKEIMDHEMENHVIIQSFDFRTLQYLHKHYPQIKTAILIDENNKRSIMEQLKDLGFIPTIYSPSYSLVNKDVVHFCHKQHIKVIPWTVNSLQEVTRLKELNVDGIITDYPNLLF